MDSPVRYRNTKVTCYRRKTVTSKQWRFCQKKQTAVSKQILINQFNSQSEEKFYSKRVTMVLGKTEIKVAKMFKKHFQTFGDELTEDVELIDTGIKKSGVVVKDYRLAPEVLYVEPIQRRKQF